MLGGGGGGGGGKNMIKMVRSGALSMLLSTKKSTIIRNLNQQLKLCALFFSKINPDAHVNTKIITFTSYKGGVFGAILLYINYYKPGM